MIQYQKSFNINVNVPIHVEKCVILMNRYIWILNQNSETCLQWQVELMGALTFLVFFLSIFLRLIVTCRFCVIYGRKDSDSNV